MQSALHSLCLCRWGVLSGAVGSVSVLCFAVERSLNRACTATICRGQVGAANGGQKGNIQYGDSNLWNDQSCDSKMGFVCGTEAAANLSPLPIYENGASSSGWSNKWVTDAGKAGLIHGLFGIDVKQVSKAFRVPSASSFCTVSWTHWAVAPNDKMLVAELYIDDDLVWDWEMCEAEGDAGAEAGLGGQQVPVDVEDASHLI